MAGNKEIGRIGQRRYGGTIYEEVPAGAERTQRDSSLHGNVRE